MTDDFCFDCKYSYVVENMQGCVWESGLKSRQVKCNRYKWSWQKALLPYAVMLFIFLLVIRMILIVIWGI